MSETEVETPHGPARVELHPAPRPAGAALLLGHGAGGGFGAPDLHAVTGVATDAGFDVVQIKQPYRVAGRRAPAPARQLDAAWLAVVAHLRAGRCAGMPLIFGGRSSGARVACRTSAEGGASAVLCLAFPEHPPGKPERSRQAELDAVALPVLVVQGERDPFGRPTVAGRHELVMVAGDHSLKTEPDTLRRSVAEWLSARLAAL